MDLPFDLDAMRQEHEADYRERREFNRIAKDRKAAASLIETPDDTPEEPVSIADLSAQLQALYEANEELSRQSYLRSRRRGSVTQLRQVLSRKNTEIENLVADIQTLEQRLENARERSCILGKQIRDKEEEIAALPPLGSPVDPEPIQQQIEAAESINQNVEHLRRKEAILAEARDAEQKSKALTEKIDERKELVRKGLAEVVLPVEGLELRGGKVYFDGVPFDQASDAEQLRVSCLVAMRQHAKLRVIRVRDGSLLDDDSLSLLAEMADAHDYQVWIERVDSSGKIGFVIEDGSLLTTSPHPARRTA